MQTKKIFNFNKYLLNNLPILSCTQKKNDLFLQISSKNVKQVFTFMKYNTNCQYKSLIDICAVDLPFSFNRFNLIYNILSIKYNSRIFITVNINELDEVFSLKNIYLNSSWMEREIWDMFGIIFFNHGDLRRLLTDYGFEGHPLRKDFPLNGFIEINYDVIKKRIVYIPSNLSKKFNNYNFSSPWNINKL